MKKCLFFVLVIFLVGIFAFPTNVQANTIPVIEVTNFQGTPQTLTPEIRNSGDITLTLNLGDYDLSSLDYGKVTIRYYDGTEFIIRNLWRCEENLCTWDAYIPDDVEYIYINTQTPTQWIGLEPWEGSYEPYGIHKKEQVTNITFFINDPLYSDWDGLYDPTWEWSVVGSPEWAANQWFVNNRVDITIFTNCSGHGDNHGGLFAWEDVPPFLLFGNGVFRQWVKEPISPVQWEIRGTVGNMWIQTGRTSGPVCWNSLTYLPLINK